MKRDVEFHGHEMSDAMLAEVLAVELDMRLGILIIIAVSREVVSKRKACFDRSLIISLRATSKWSKQAVLFEIPCATS